MLAADEYAMRARSREKIPAIKRLDSTVKG